MPFIGTIISAKLHLCQVTEIIFIMMTSSNGNIFRVTGSLCGEFTGPGEFPTQRPVTRSFDVFFDLRLNKRLSKQPWGWWFETPSWSLWRHFHDRLSVIVFSGYLIFICDFRWLDQITTTVPNLKMNCNHLKNYWKPRSSWCQLCRHHRLS